MDTQQPLLEIHVHVVSGQTARFGQDEPAHVQHLLETIGQPSRLFSQPHLIVGGDRSMSVFRSEWVTRVDLIGAGLPEWPFLQGAVNVQEITEDMFRLRFEPEVYAAARLKAWATPGERQTGFTELELVTGDRIFWEVIMESRPLMGTDMGPFVQALLEAGGLHARRLDGGTMVVNPANVARLTFHPGPPQFPPKAWTAHRL